MLLLHCHYIHVTIFLFSYISARIYTVTQDWPLLCSGSVMTQSLLDALMIQSVFTPDILAFWEALTGTL